MKLSHLRIALLCFSSLLAANLKAELVSEATFGSGYRSNLFNDSSLTGDTYGSARMDLKYYPSASAQLAAGAQYDVYAEHDDLSSINGDVSVTVIPTPATSRFALSLAGSAAARYFGPLYKAYDQVGTSVGANLGYRLARWAYLQSSGSHLSTVYTNSDYGSNRGIALAAGINFTVPGSNSLALTGEYSRRSFDQPPSVQQSAGHNQAIVQDNSETFEVTGVLLRFSRPLGERTGVNLSVGRRQLHVNNDYTVYGYTIDYLSPWADLWDGTSFSVGVKHFFPKQITTELSFAYFDKTFVDVIELAETTDEILWRDGRDDQLTALSLSASRPVTLKDGKLLIPVIRVGYRKNRSSIGYFDYEDLSASFSMKIAL